MATSCPTLFRRFSREWKRPGSDIMPMMGIGQQARPQKQPRSCALVDTASTSPTDGRRLGDGTLWNEIGKPGTCCVCCRVRSPHREGAAEIGIEDALLLGQILAFQNCTAELNHIAAFGEP